MPRELKPARSYHEALRRIGVQDPGEVQVGVPVQLQAIVDDFSHLVPPLEVPVAIGGVNANGVVAQYAGMELQTGANGVWVESIGLLIGTDCRLAIGQAPTTYGDLGRVAVVPSAIISGPVTATMYESQGSVVPPLDGSWQLVTTNTIQPLGVYLPAGGWILSIVSIAVNVTVGPMIHWREVPRPALDIP